MTAWLQARVGIVVKADLAAWARVFHELFAPQFFQHHQPRHDTVVSLLRLRHAYQQKDVSGKSVSKNEYSWLEYPTGNL